MIQRVIVYETDGRQFPTVKKAVEHREGLIEEFLRKSPGFENMPAKDRIAFVQSVIDNRKRLIGLLDYAIPTEDE